MGMSSPPHCRDAFMGVKIPLGIVVLHQNLLRKSWRGQAKVISATDLLIAHPEGAAAQARSGQGRHQTRLRCPSLDPPLPRLKRSAGWMSGLDFTADASL